MKLTKALVLTLGLIAFECLTYAADTTAGSKIKPPITKLDDSPITKPVPPVKPENPTASTEIKDVIQNFEQARESLLANQKVLLESLKGASEDQREKIREQLKQAKDALAAQREQFRDQLKEIKDKLLDQAKKLKDQTADGAKKTGKPRGD